MNLKKYLTLNIFIIFILMFLAHFIYNIFPNNLIAIFFPVNESIFEHMKMIYTTFIISSIIEYFVLKKLNINFNNFFSATLLSSLSSIFSFLIIWLPIYFRIGENMFLTIIVLFISIYISQVVNYYILSKTNNKLLNCISLILIIVLSILFGYFTFYPLYNKFFFDPLAEKYGINIYKIK